MRAATFCSLFTSLLLGAWSSVPTKVTPLQQPEIDQPDLLVVGAGISGLSSALEVAQKGAQVTVVDLWSVFGGHAVVAGGVLSIVDTPFQVSEGIQDSPDLAYHDFTVWGEDADPEWVRLYVDRSRSLIYDWVTTMGVEFGSLTRPPGNSVPRVHRTRGEGLALVSAIYRECLKWPNVTFIWNHKVTGLVKAQGRVVGVQAINVRSQEELVLRASAVVLATGGFQTNLKMVRQFWPDHLQFPERLLVSSGFNALGSGHALAQEAGGTIYDMDHQWNYSTGIPDPRHPGTNRGFFARSPAAIWVNVQGERFVNESGSTKMTFPAVVNQESSRFWAVFDEAGRKKLEIRGTASDDPKEMILQLSPDLIKRADSIEQLAMATGLDVMTLQSTVNRFNRFVEKGEDEDFQRFERTRTPSEEIPLRPYTAQKIEKPPFYALLTFPVTRKSMGGVLIDLSCRVLDRQGDPIPGLYAVGELTGFGGVNGKAGLEGTFLGPSIVAGRVAAQTVLQDLQIQTSESLPNRPTASRVPSDPDREANNQACLRCHLLPDLMSAAAAGYSHFKLVHHLVLERQQRCGTCHPEFLPVRMHSHQFDRLTQLENCVLCH